MSFYFFRNYVIKKNKERGFPPPPKTWRWMSMVSREAPLKSEERGGIIWHKNVSRFARTNYFYQMSFLSKLLALRNNDVRDQQSDFNMHLNSITVPIPRNQTKCNGANFALLFTASCFLLEQWILVASTSNLTWKYIIFKIFEHKISWCI